MNSGRAVFSQVMDHLPAHEFHRCVRRYGGNRRQRGFSCMDQFLCMAFAQLTGRESLRDIEVCLRSLGPRLYHLGFRGRISRSTLADANEARDWRIWADLAQALICIARPLYAHEALDADLEATVYALDSSTIDLCLSLFPWARFQRTKSAVKLHTLLDLRGSIPTFIRITNGKTHDVNVLDELAPEAGSFYVMDRGYLDFARLYLFVRCSAFYVVRSKKNVQLNRRYSHPAAIADGVLSDHTVVLRTRDSARAYPEALRRVRFHDSITDKRLVLLTNNFELEALTDRAALQVPLAGRAVLQMDQATPPRQGLLRPQRERCEDPDLDCHRDLLAGRHPQETARPRRQSLQTPTGSQHHRPRENPRPAGLSAHRLQCRNTRPF